MHIIFVRRTYLLIIKSFIFQKEWFEGYQLASAMNFKFPQFKRIALNTVVPNASRDGIHLMELLLSWNPIRRPSAQSALRYLFNIIQQIHNNL